MFAKPRIDLFIKDYARILLFIAAIILNLYCFYIIKNTLMAYLSAIQFISISCGLILIFLAQFLCIISDDKQSFSLKNSVMASVGYYAYIILIDSVTVQPVLLNDAQLINVILKFSAVVPLVISLIAFIASKYAFLSK